jgi:NAD(P)-dependent dehydrogenase (short-subunit alcohol dehydrogenase family)
MMCQAFMPSMVRRRYGRVVNVSSGAGQLSSMATYAPAYSISKAALNAVTVQLAGAVKGTGVLVNSVDPGWVRTRMGGSSAPRSVEQGAETIVWAATFGPKGASGRFFSDKREIGW